MLTNFIIIISQINPILSLASQVQESNNNSPVFIREDYVKELALALVQALVRDYSAKGLPSVRCRMNLSRRG